MNASHRSPIRIALLAMLGSLATMFLVVALAFAGGSRVASEKGSAGNPRILPPSSNPYGASYATWTVRWWQWAYSLPVAGHPLFDETGADCGAGQSGPVWFLGGIFNNTGTANRTQCVVPSGKALFFPIVNAEWDNFCPIASMSDAELRQFVTDAMDDATNMSCEIDGTPVQNLQVYRSAGPAFGVDMPAGSIFDLFCETPAGHYEPMVPDGYYLMLAPLSVGKHTLHFIGTIPAFNGFTLEITYELTVSADGHATTEIADPAAGGAVAPVSGATNPGNANSSWGRVKSIYR